MMIKETILDLLPKQGGATNRVDWENSRGCYIPFIYGDTKGVLKVLDHKTEGTKDKRILVEYNGKETWLLTASLRRGEIKQAIDAPRKTRTVKLKPNEFKKGQILKDDKRHIRLLGEGFKLMGEHKIRGFKYECLCCGHKGFKPVRQLRIGSGCANWKCRNEFTNNAQ